jgi:hypothetical protein
VVAKQGQGGRDEDPADDRRVDEYGRGGADPEDLWMMSYTDAVSPVTG